MTMNNYCCKSMPCRSIKMLQKHLLWSGKLKNNKTEDTVGDYLIVMSYRIHQPFLFVPDELLKNFVQQENKIFAKYCHSSEAIRATLLT